MYMTAELPAFLLPLLDAPGPSLLVVVLPSPGQRSFLFFCTRIHTYIFSSKTCYSRVELQPIFRHSRSADIPYLLSPESSIPSECSTQHRTKRPTTPAALRHQPICIFNLNPHTQWHHRGAKPHLRTPHRTWMTTTRNTSMDAPHTNNNRICLNSRSKVSAIHHHHKCNNSGRPCPVHHGLVIRWRRRWRVCSRVLRPWTVPCAA
jgi:hypothetical protein